MALLAELRSLVGHLPEDPLQDVVFSMRVGGQEFSGFFREVGHDGAGLEDRDRLAAAHRFVVNDCRHTAVGGDLEERGRQLVASADVDRFEIVGEAEFLEQDEGFLAVSGGPEIEVDHWCSPRWIIVAAWPATCNRSLSARIFTTEDDARATVATEQEFLRYARGAKFLLRGSSWPPVRPPWWKRLLTCERHHRSLVPRR